MGILGADKATGRNMYVVAGDLKQPTGVKAMEASQQPTCKRVC